MSQFYRIIQFNLSKRIWRVLSSERKSVLFKNLFNLSFDCISIEVPQVFNFTIVKLQIFFKPSYEGYNVLLTLRKNLVRTSHVYDFFKNFKKPDLVEETVPAADFNPVEYYLRDLRVSKISKRYSDFID